MQGLPVGMLLTLHDSAAPAAADPTAMGSGVRRGGGLERHTQEAAVSCSLAGRLKDASKRGEEANLHGVVALQAAEHKGDAGQEQGAGDAAQGALQRGRRTEVACPHTPPPQRVPPGGLPQGPEQRT